MLKSAFAVVLAMMTLAAAGPAGAWGSSGHRMVGRLAAEALPPEVPAFLRTSRAAQLIGELSREPDRSKGAGKTHDLDLDPGHFLDLGDDGKVFGGPALASLPQTRADYESALRAVGQDSWKAGYLPYSIVSGWQQLTLDLAYWRTARTAARTASTPAHRAWFAADAAERQQLVLRDLGFLSHMVGDGSQPLHVTIHYNGWGDFPNPDGFSNDRLHGPFEGKFIHNFVTAQQARARMVPFRDCGCPVEQRTADYLATTARQVVPFYQLYKAGGFADADPRGEAFAAERLGAGASELRDLVVLAWRASANSSIGWPAVKVADVEAGRVRDPYDSFIGTD